MKPRQRPDPTSTSVATMNPALASLRERAATHRAWARSRTGGVSTLGGKRRSSASTLSARRTRLAVRNERSSIVARSIRAMTDWLQPLTRPSRRWDHRRPSLADFTVAATWSRRDLVRASISDTPAMVLRRAHLAVIPGHRRPTRSPSMTCRAAESSEHAFWSRPRLPRSRFWRNRVRATLSRSPDESSDASRVLGVRVAARPAARPAPRATDAEQRPGGRGPGRCEPRTSGVVDGLRRGPWARCGSTSC